MNLRLAAFVLVTALACATGDAHAARPLLAKMLARAPVKAGQPAMSAAALEACLRRARELDATGTAIDYEIAAIDRETAEAMFLENQINAAIPALDGYDQPGLNAFQKRVIRHEGLAKKFKAKFSLYQQKQKAYDARLSNSTATARRALPPPSSAR